MNLIRSTILLTALTAMFVHEKAIANSGHIPIIGTTWHIYQCVDPVSKSGENQVAQDTDTETQSKDCDAQTGLQTHSFLHIEQGFSNSVIAIFKIAHHPRLQVFSGTIEETYEIGGKIIGRVIRFNDSPDNAQKAVNKRLHLYLTQTKGNQNIGGKSCSSWLSERAHGGNKFPVNDICNQDDHGEYRNVIFWRIEQTEEDRSMDMQIPPDDGQGSGSDEPPQ